MLFRPFPNRFCTLLHVPYHVMQGSVTQVVMAGWKLPRHGQRVQGAVSGSAVVLRGAGILNMNNDSLRCIEPGDSSKADMASDEGEEPYYGYMGTPDGGHYVGYDLQGLRNPHALLVAEMMGAPLTQHHGALLRLYTSTKYGYKQIKRIGLTAYFHQSPTTTYRTRLQLVRETVTSREK